MLFLCKCNLFFYTTFHLKPGWTRLLPVFCFLPKTWRLRQTKKTPPEFCSAILNFLKVQEFFSRPDERSFLREIIPRSQLKWRTNRYCCYWCFAKRSDPHCFSSVARFVRRKTKPDQLFFFSFKRHNSDSACIKQSSSSAVWEIPGCERYCFNLRKPYFASSKLFKQWYYKTRKIYPHLNSCLINNNPRKT